MQEFTSHARGPQDLVGHGIDRQCLLFGQCDQMAGSDRRTELRPVPCQQVYPQNLGTSFWARNGLVIVALVSLLGSQSACTITTHDNVPLIDVQTPPMLPQNVPIYYRVEPWVYWRDAIFAAKSDHFIGSSADLEEYRELERAFRNSGIFSAANPRLTPPEKGLYCSVQVESQPVSDVGAAALAVSHATSAVLPTYHGTSRHVVRFHLFVDREFKKTYEYTIGTKQGIWLGLVPFVWVNAFTPSLGEALHATTYQFFIDAALDGFIRQM